MTAICNGTDLSALVGYGYQVEQVPQYGNTMTAIDGTDYTVKLRDRWHIVVPFIALTKAQLSMVLSLFPAGGPYVSWTFYDQNLGYNRTLEFKYEARKASMLVSYRNGVEYWSGLSVDLMER